MVLLYLLYQLVLLFSQFTHSSYMSNVHIFHIPLIVTFILSLLWYRVYPLSKTLLLTMDEKENTTIIFSNTIEEKRFQLFLVFNNTIPELRFCTHRFNTKLSFSANTRWSNKIQILSGTYYLLKIENLHTWRWTSWYYSCWTDAGNTISYTVSDSQIISALTC